MVRLRKKRFCILKTMLISHFHRKARKCCQILELAFVFCHRSPTPQRKKEEKTLILQQTNIYTWYSGNRPGTASSDNKERHSWSSRSETRSAHVTPIMVTVKDVSTQDQDVPRPSAVAPLLFWPEVPISDVTRALTLVKTPLCARSLSQLRDSVFVIISSTRFLTFRSSLAF